MGSPKSQVNLKKKELLRKKISNLEYNEQCEIFNIIRKDTDKISENTNGIFINLKCLKDETIEKMFNFVDYCEKNKILMDTEEKKIKNEFINNISSNPKNLFNRKSDAEDDNSVENYEEEENLSEGYEYYVLENQDYFKEKSEFSTEKDGDKFSFKTYIDKLSVTSQKDFQDTEVVGEKKILPSGFKKPKIKLTGVKARLMKRCRNINKFNYDNYKNKTTIIEDNLNNKLENLDDINTNFDDDDEDLADSISNCSEIDEYDSTIEELQEEII